jgi:hypothetical protein
MEHIFIRIFYLLFSLRGLVFNETTKKLTGQQFAVINLYEINKF